MLKHRTMQNVLQETSLSGSLNPSAPLQVWPYGSSSGVSNWAHASAGNHDLAASQDFMKDFEVLPAIQNANNSAVQESGKGGEMESIEIGTKLNPGRRIEYLERSIQFLKAQHMELVTSLHEEVDRLQRKNKELQFCIVMMQQSMRVDKDQSTTRDHISTKRSAAKSTQSTFQSGVVQRNLKTSPEESNISHQDGELVKTKPTSDVTPRTGNTDHPLQGSEKLEELKLLFLEEEIKELKKSLDCERKQNQYLNELLRRAQQEREAAVAAAAADNNINKSDVSGTGETVEIGQPSKGLADVVLPFGATLDPLLVHLPSQPARPPTLRECQSIARHLQQVNNRQAHELNQLKTDLRDVLYSHKWTPDAYLLARAYVAEDDIAEAAQQPQRSLPRIPMKHSTKKLPDSAYAAQESVTLPSLKTVVGNQAIERQKRTQCLQKTKSAKQWL